MIPISVAAWEKVWRGPGSARTVATAARNTAAAATSTGRRAASPPPLPVRLDHAALSQARAAGRGGRVIRAWIRCRPSSAGSIGSAAARSARRSSSSWS